jgi:hypothetical protein
MQTSPIQIAPFKNKFEIFFNMDFLSAPESVAPHWKYSTKSYEYAVVCTVVATQRLGCVGLCSTHSNAEALLHTNIKKHAPNFCIDHKIVKITKK